jgi:hypothetical protein
MYDSFTKGQHVIKSNIICPFFFWRTYSDWQNIPSYDGHCFATYSCRNSFPARWCTTSLLSPCLCLCGERISSQLDRNNGPEFPGPLILQILLAYTALWHGWAVVKEKRFKMQMSCMKELFGAAEFVTNEMLTSIWKETENRLEMCRATDEAHTHICWARKKLARYSVWKCINFSNTLSDKKDIQRFIWLYFKARDAVHDEFMHVNMGIHVQTILVHYFLLMVPYESTEFYLSLFVKSAHHACFSLMGNSPGTQILCLKSNCWNY